MVASKPGGVVGRSRGNSGFGSGRNTYICVQETCIMYMHMVASRREIVRNTVCPASASLHGPALLANLYGTTQVQSRRSL